MTEKKVLSVCEKEKAADLARFQRVKKIILGAGKTELKKEDYKDIINQLRKVLNKGGKFIL